MQELYKIGAAYVRVSDERQDEYSPDSQLKKVREYAAKEGYDIPEEYVYYDDGISGRSTRKRTAFNTMISVAKEKDHPFDKIYVWKFSRFARNQEESMVYKNLLAKKGVDVISVSEPIPAGPFGDLIERIIEWSDEYYSTNLSVEVRRGMTEKASRGEPNGPPPYGYVMKNGKYIPDESSGAANVIREIFERYAAGEGMRELAVSLGARGVRTTAGNKPDNRWIEYILNNPCYVGKLRWSKDGVRAVSKRDYFNENIMTVDASHTPLISIDLWERVKKLLDTQKKTYPKYSRPEQTVNYLLKGLARCSACGATLIIGCRSGKSGKPSLQCHNYTRGSCHTSHSITVPKIDAAFKQGLRDAVENKSFVMVPTEARKKTTFDINYSALIAVEERKLERAKQAYLAEIDTLEQYRENKERIIKRIADLKKESEAQPPLEFDKDAFAKKITNVLALLDDDQATTTAKNEALHTIINKVVYEKAKSNLAIYFHDI